MMVGSSFIFVLLVYRAASTPTGDSKVAGQLADTAAIQDNGELGEMEEANHVIPLPHEIEPGVVLSFNYKLPPEHSWKEEGQLNDWVYSSWRPEYTIDYHWLCPMGLRQKGIHRTFEGCVTIAELKYYNQVKEILIDTYEIGRINSYDLRDVKTNCYIVPEKLDGGDIEVSLVMLGTCIRLNYKVGSDLEVTTKFRSVKCDTVGYAETNPKKQHKWKWNVDPDEVKDLMKQKLMSKRESLRID